MKRLLYLSLASLFSLAILPASSGAVSIFTATIDGLQQPTPVITNASGTAILELDDTQTRLEINIQLNGLDLDGLQTPGDASDDVTLAHIHNAPVGVNGGVVFGFIGPDSDTTGDLVVDPVAGTIFSAWDLNEGNNTTLALQLGNLLAGELYINIHTTTNPGGEIRGQIVPEPSTLGMLSLGLLVLHRVRRR